MKKLLYEVNLMMYDSMKTYREAKKQRERDLLAWLNRAERRDREKEWLTEVLRSNMTVKKKDVND